MSVRFFLRNKSSLNTSLNIVVCFNAQKINFTSGLNVQSRFWNQAKQRLKESPSYLDAIYINQAIKIQENVYNDAIRYFIAKQINPSQKEFKTKVMDLFSLINADHSKNNELFLDFMLDTIEKYKAIRKSETIKSYNVIHKKLLKYQTENKLQLTFADIDEKFYLHFRKWFFKQDYSINYFANFIKTIKMFMTLANDQKITNSTDYKLKSFKKITEESDNIYLTVDELLKIYHLDFSEYPILNHPAYYLTRNKFLIGAFTGLRVSDFNRLNEINLSDDFIRIKQHKTERLVIIPIHNIVKEILQSGFNIHEVISDQKINEYIKVICREAKIITPILVHKSNGGVIKQMQFPKCQLVSTHTARRSFATNAFKSGIPSISIMQITGHRSEKSFLKYIKITAEENALLLSKHPFFMNS